MNIDSCKTCTVARLVVHFDDVHGSSRELSSVPHRSSAIQSDNRITDLEMQLKELNAVKTDHGMVVTLGDVLFDSGKSQLLPSGKRNMVKLADFFKRYPQVTATIGGYTDSVGAATYNRHLSQRRTTSAILELVSLGVERERLITQGYGESNPIASNDTPDGRKINRRVEVVFNQKD